MPIDKSVLASIEKARAEYLASRRPQRPGKDWFTAQEYADGAGLASRESAHLRLTKMLKGGLVERRRIGRDAYWKVRP